MMICSFDKWQKSRENPVENLIKISNKNFAIIPL